MQIDTAQFHVKSGNVTSIFDVFNYNTFNNNYCLNSVTLHFTHISNILREYYSTITF